MYEYVLGTQTNLKAATEYSSTGAFSADLVYTAQSNAKNKHTHAAALGSLALALIIVYNAVVIELELAVWYRRYTRTESREQMQASSCVVHTRYQIRHEQTNILKFSPLALRFAFFCRISF